MIERLNINLRGTLPDASVKATSLPGCPEVSLYLYDPNFLSGPLDHDVAQAVVAEPAYWSFCWASGQAMASYILAHGSEIAGKRVLDFGAGSGVVAIACALAGASEVIALDIDSMALDACRANAELNGVSVRVVRTLAEAERLLGDTDIDLVTAADVLYDQDNMHLLDELLAFAPVMLLADSRIKHFNHPAYDLLDVYTCRTWPDLQEFEEFNRVRIYKGKGSFAKVSVNNA